MVKGEACALPPMLPTKEMTVKKTITPMTSSMAAKGISVPVTGPRVRYSLTMDRAGAGAVASAIPPKMNARYRGMPEIANTIMKTAETNRKVPMD